MNGNFRFRKAILRAYILCCALLSCCPDAQAQRKALLLTDHSTKSMWIGRVTEYVKDPAGTLTIADVTSPGFSGRFIPATMDALAFGNELGTIWCRFRVVNQSARPWLLSVLNYDLDSLQFFYPDSTGAYRVVESGAYRPLSTRRYMTNAYAFELPVRRGATATCYLRINAYKPEVPMMVGTYEQFVADRYQNNLIKGMYYGFVLLLIIYSLTLFFAFKERAYLFYVFYVFFTALLMSEHAGINALLWGNSLHFLWSCGPTITALSIIFFWIFSNNFLNLRRQLFWGFCLGFFVVVPGSITAIVLNLTHHNLYASMVNQLTALISLISGTVVGIALYRRGFKPARYYILANTFYFIGVIIFILKTAAVLPYNNFTTNALEIGSAVEMIMFSVSMADRINVLRRERAAAMRAALIAEQEQERRVLEETARQLETKVEERTTELNQSLVRLRESQHQLEEKNEVISRERDRSDALLLNILPYETAQELKETGKAIARPFEQVTIMFTDFKDFTGISEGLSPEQLVAELDYCFRNFDEIAERHGVEKIKTIGDSYMAAGGLPVPNSSHPVDVVRAAIDIQQFMHRYNDRRIGAGLPPFEIRIGIHTGPVVAGIVGTRKFAYDIWGDSVNLASRMESSSEAGRINISGATHAFVKQDFRCSYRGKIPAKNKGEVDMYFVEPV